jgi:hypothetical protein
MMRLALLTLLTALLAPLVASAQMMDENDDGKGWNHTWSVETVDGVDEVVVTGTADLPDKAVVDGELYVRNGRWRDILKVRSVEVKDGTFEVRFTPFPKKLWPAVYEVDITWDPSLQIGDIKEQPFVSEKPWKHYRRKTIATTVGDPKAARAEWVKIFIQDIRDIQKHFLAIQTLFASFAENHASLPLTAADVSAALGEEIPTSSLEARIAALTPEQRDRAIQAAWTRESLAWETILEKIGERHFVLNEQRVLYGWDLPTSGVANLRKELKVMMKMVRDFLPKEPDWTKRKSFFDERSAVFTGILTRFSDYFKLGSVHAEKIEARIRIVSDWLDQEEPPTLSEAVRLMMELQTYVGERLISHVADLTKELSRWARTGAPDAREAAQAHLRTLQEMVR